MIADTAMKTIAVVRGSSGAQVQDAFAGFVERWRGSIRLAGLIAEVHDLPDRACSAGFLVDQRASSLSRLSDGPRTLVDVASLTATTGAHADTTSPVLR